MSTHSNYYVIRPKAPEDACTHANERSPIPQAIARISRRLIASRSFGVRSSMLPPYVQPSLPNTCSPFMLMLGIFGASEMRLVLASATLLRLDGSASVYSAAENAADGSGKGRQTMIRV
jgi:hypothetical protein